LRIHDLLSSDDLVRVAKLQLLARQVVAGFASGQHRSPHKGFSVEFKEHRPYVRGDELRNIDWKVFAKSDRLYIRQSEEDTNLRCTLMVDRSGSMQYAGDRPVAFTKHEYAQQLAASLAYLMLSQQDAVGVFTFDDQIRDHVPCRSRPSHWKPLLAALAQPPDRRETDIGGVLQSMAGKLGRRGLLVILSDAMADVDSIGRAVAQFRSAKHECLFFQILDPDEIDFPFRGRIQFRNLEQSTDQRTLDAITVRGAYRRRFAQHQAALRDMCRKNRVDWIPLTTDRPLVDALHEYMTLRKRIR
jgi:uncharacterized protein (DUF58 family)